MDTSSETLNSNIAKEDREMTNKCSLWDFASGQKENLRTYMKKKTLWKNYSSATNVTFQLFMQAVCGHI